VGLSLLSVLFIVGLVVKVGEKMNATAAVPDERVLVAGDAENRIAVIELVGAIDGYGNHALGSGMVQEVAEQLRLAREDASVKAVLLAVDSPGGGLTASDVLFHEVQLLQAQSKKVIVTVGGMAASGGYYVIVSADYIFLQPTGLVGSFGVIMTHFEIDELLQKIGVRVEPLKSVAGKDLASPFRAMTPAERERFTKILTAYHDRFIALIAAGRHQAPEKIAPLATGDIYTAAEAVALQLVDEIGYYDDAVAYTRNLVGANAEVFTYAAPLTLAKLLTTFSGKFGGSFGKGLGESLRGGMANLR
jgi:protease-4